MEIQKLPKQPSLFTSYLHVSKWLLFSQFLFVAESIFYWQQLQQAEMQSSLIWIGFWWSCFLFAFLHIFLVFMDSWSRFQNYKRIKDQLYLYGFKPKIANNYTSSKCQRHALNIACKELGMTKDVRRFMQLRGIKWYHFIPQFMAEDPLFLFKKQFWNRTFLEKYYAPKFCFQTIYATSVA